MDQVLLRYMMQMDQHEGTDKTRDHYEGPFLAVSQTWLWQIGDCIFTSQFDRFNRPVEGSLSSSEYLFQEAAQSVGLMLSELLGRMVWNELDGLSDTEPPDLLVMFAASIALITQKVSDYVDSEQTDENSIRDEKEFLHQIEDIREEISMIQTVLNQQEEAWREYTFNAWPEYL